MPVRTVRHIVVVLLVAMGLQLSGAETPTAITITPGTVTYVENQASIQVVQLGVSVIDGAGSLDTGTLRIANSAPTADDYLTIEAYAVPDVGTAPTVIPGRTIAVVDTGIDYTYGISSVTAGTQTIVRVTRRVGFLSGGDGAHALTIALNGNAELIRQANLPLVADLIRATRFRVLGDNPLGRRDVAFQATSASGVASSTSGAVATVVIGPVNDPPIAPPITMNGPSAQTLTATGALVDLDNALLTLTVTGAPHGTVTMTDRLDPARTLTLPAGGTGTVQIAVAAGYTVTYLSENRFTGTDVVSFVASDGFASAGSTMTFVITNAPAISTTLASMEGVPVYGTLPATIDGLTATYTIDSGPTLGELAILPATATSQPFTFTPIRSVAAAAAGVLAVDRVRLSAHLPNGVIVPAQVSIAITSGATTEGRPSFRRIPDREIAMVGSTITNELVIDSSFASPRVDFALLEPVAGATVTPLTGRSARLTVTPTAPGCIRIPVVVTDPTTMTSDVRVYVIVVLPAPSAAS